MRSPLYPDTSERRPLESQPFGFNQPKGSRCQARGKHQPFTAERDVDNELLAAEETRDVARWGGVGSGGRPPAADIQLVRYRLQIVGNMRTLSGVWSANKENQVTRMAHRPKPDANGQAG